MKGPAVKQFMENFQKGYGLMRGFMQDRAVAEATEAKVEDLAPVKEIQVGEGGETTTTDVAPQQYKFLGKTYDQPLTDSQISMERNRAVANAYKRWGNAAEGLKLENDLLRQDQENKKFGEWEKEAAEKDRLRGLIKQRDQIVADANKPADVATGFALDGQAGGTMAFASQANANTVAEGFGDVVKPEVKPAAWTDRLDGNKKLYTGLNAAVEAKQYNESNPITGYSRYRAIYDKLSSIPGMQDEADKYLDKLKEARTEGAFEVLAKLEHGDSDGAMTIWNQLGSMRAPEGSRLVKVAEKSGQNQLGYSGPQYALVGKDGQVLSEDVAASVNRNILGPKAVAELAIKRAAKQEERQDKLEDQAFLLRLRGDIKAEGAGGDGTGSGSGSGGGKKSKTPLEETLDAIKDSYDAEPKDGTEGATTPEQRLVARSAAAEIHKLNPKINAGTAAIAARAYAKTADNPAALIYGWDDNTNSVIEKVWTPQGPVAVNAVTPFNAPVRGLPANVTKAALDSSLNKLTGGDPSKRSAVIQAAMDVTGQARRALLDSIVNKRLQGEPRFKTLTPEQQAIVRASQERIVENELTVPLHWIKTYAQSPAK